MLLAANELNRARARDDELKAGAELRLRAIAQAVKGQTELRIALPGVCPRPLLPLPLKAPSLSSSYPRLVVPAQKREPRAQPADQLQHAGVRHDSWAIRLPLQVEMVGAPGLGRALLRVRRVMESWERKRVTRKTNRTDPLTHIHTRVGGRRGRARRREEETEGNRGDGAIEADQ